MLTAYDIFSNCEMEVMRLSLPKIVVLGAGYGSLMTLKGLQKELHYNEAEIVLIAPHSYHYITTKLHEPAAGTLKDQNVQVELSTIINTERIQVIQQHVKKIDVERKQVHLENNNSISFDYLVVGLGSSPETFGIKGLLEHAFFIRDIDSAQTIRSHMEKMFSSYAQDQSEEFLTIVVGGAGLTGVEYIGELVERIPELCLKFNIHAHQIRILNIEAMSNILAGFDDDLIEYARNFLEKHGVRFLINSPIEECTSEGVILKGGQVIKAKTVIWTGGIRGHRVVEESALETVRGRVKVDEHLRAQGREDIFIVGDCSLVFDEEHRPYPPTAQIATMQGLYLGKQLPMILRKGELKPFSFKPKGTIASLGGREAVGFIGSKKVYGRIASLLKKAIDARWLFLLGGIPLIIRKEVLKKR